MVKAIKAYYTVASEARTEFTEKKSVFISHIRPVDTEEQAKEFIEKIRAKHSDATHNVYAYILKDTCIARFSDDGEPQGTAGMPALEVLKRENLEGVAVVITRYFGGILLGAGGLVRAYAKSAKLALDAAGVCEYVPFVNFKAKLSYSDSERVQKEVSKYNVLIKDTEYSDYVYLYLAAEKEDAERFFAKLTDMTSARASCEITGESFEKKQNHQNYVN